ncbi:peptidoglycan D,D-transpeptidase FtsI family protein [Paenibacillus sp. MBLB4367]|uniref:peptidoglycan D,D-transpeptidase FtsI family protein n=1 Tax=Paenibacillus sp. MBLB4367 TaxID=3384767 RepID=UPI0039084224
MLDKRRIVFVLLAVSVMMGVLAVRLLMVQVVPGFGHASSALIRHSVEQREQRVVLDSGRGGFYDRSGLPLTGERYAALLVFPNKEQAKKSSGVAAAAGILGVSEREWLGFLQGLKQPAWWTKQSRGPASDESLRDVPLRLTDAQAKRLKELRVPGITVTTYESRYIQPYPASQLIGFIGENPERVQAEYADKLARGQFTLASRIGGSGLEKTFQPYVQGIGPTTLSLFTDGQNNPLSGLDVRLVEPVNVHYPTKVVTALSLPAESKIEALLDRLHVRKGAVVVLDAKTADIVAMSSRPAFNPYRIKLDERGWENRALQAAEPGSVFKTVVAAAALEEGVVKPNEVFRCEGELGKYGFSCWLPGGHGNITFSDAFAESCNITFAKVMQRLSSETLAAYARKLGVLLPVGWTGDTPGQPSFRQLDGEDGGQLFAPGTPPNDEGVRAQTAIGQRDVRMTPLAAANMVVTLLNGGVVREPRAVTEIRYQSGRLLYAFPEKTVSGRMAGISPKTAATLLAWMQGVVDHGTGKSLQKAKWKLAGKSGTAQTGSGSLVHQWFVGFGPTDEPRFAAAVMIADTDASEAGLANAVFRGVMDIMAESAPAAAAFARP